MIFLLLKKETDCKDILGAFLSDVGSLRLQRVIDLQKVASKY